ncbi:SUMF1/EgtB/PvdO family nonheme iron enzyme [Nakamurella endophytica]|uniref:Sulfatase-modifying factor enzyme-like domain-containing protein n=1 Tax=Nakamurella endophytica TaxID=1748367 RepID=A0A917T7U1_9ACTN|nr:SUMF1/EgtB/PvdO family nonheme iron enzyme [Nakamurella endophytica]GGM13901.1 hypothetical protein GCM10011594_37200 [Nakamurella endophytica]
MSVTRHAARSDQDDAEDLRDGVDVLAGRDLLHPRPLDGPVTVDLGGVDGEPVRGLAPLSRLDGRPPSTTDMDAAKIFAGPADPADRPRWRRRLARWRDEAAARVPPGGIPGPEPQPWAARCRTVFVAWLWDDRLYDWDLDRWEPERLLDHLDREFGGVDAVVLWHAYPVIGLDERNQFDFYDVPGLPEVVDRLHRRGVRVFLDYNPWDTATRRPPAGDAAAVRDTLDRLRADGLFLDTLREAAVELVATVGTHRVLESESRISVPAMRTHQLSWAQWFADSRVPGVLRAHWLDRRHVQHHTRRWNRDHSDELQSAWLNGCGVLLWDNVFGSWVGWNERDRAGHRRMRHVHRWFGDLLENGDWTPLVDLGPAADAAGIYASRFADAGRRLYLLVNRTGTDATVDLPEPAVDLFATGAPAGPAGRVTVPARGLGAALAGPPPAGAVPGPETAPAAGTAFPERPLRRLGSPAPRVPSTGRAGPAAGADRAVPDHGAAAAGRAVPATAGRAVPLPAGEHPLVLRFRRRETGMFSGAWWVDAWKPLAPDLHAVMEQDCVVTVPAGGTRVRTAPVTRGEYLEFLRDTGYRPAVPYRFLAPDGAAADGAASGAPAVGDADAGAPVTFVDAADAAAWCAWAGGRLPTAGEWVLAASGTGAAAPGVWLRTADRYQEGPTRWTVLVGGTDRPREGSGWYFDSGPQPPGWIAKALDQGRGVGRSATVGFTVAWGPEPETRLGPERIVAPGRPIDY